MNLDPRLDEVRTHQAFGDLQFQRPVGDAIVLADLPLLLNAQDLVEVIGAKTEPSPVGSTAIWSGR